MIQDCFNLSPDCQSWGTVLREVQGVFNNNTHAGAWCGDEF